MSDNTKETSEGLSEVTNGADSEKLREELEAVVAERNHYQEELAALREQPISVLQAELSRLGKQISLMERRSFRLPSLLLSEVQAMNQLFNRFSPEATLPLVAGWALNPTGLLGLTDLVDGSDRGVVVECGSGTSTLWLAYAVRRKGRGKVIALEHSAEYAERTRMVLHAHELDDFADVLHMPLVTRHTKRGEFSWYDTESLTIDNQIDLLVVDGPPGNSGPCARYPALPLFSEMLAPGAHVLLDDTNRQEEQKVVDLWLSEEPRLKRVDPPGDAMELLVYSA